MALYLVAITDTRIDSQDKINIQMLQQTLHENEIKNIFVLFTQVDRLHLSEDEKLKRIE